MTPVSHGVCNVVKRVCIIGASVLFFGNKLTDQTKLGTAIALIGTYLYTEASKKYSKGDNFSPRTKPIAEKCGLEEGGLSSKCLQIFDFLHGRGWRTGLILLANRRNINDVPCSILQEGLQSGEPSLARTGHFTNGFCTVVILQAKQGF